MKCKSCAAQNIPGDDVCSNCGADLAGLDLPEARRGFSGRLLSDRIDNLKLSDPVTLAPDGTVADAVESMRKHRHGCVFITDADRVVGAFTERHLLGKVLRENRDPAATPLSDVMSPVPVKLHPEDPPAFAVHCMVSRSLRYLPVVSKGAFVGFLSVRNILAYLNDELISA